MIAIIGGSGLYNLKILTDISEERIKTPYGDVYPIRGRYRQKEVVFLARHGTGHTVPPHLVNYRANIWALRSIGAVRIVATAAVGSLRRRMQPGHGVVIDQFIDYTKSRPGTFFIGGHQGVAHLDYTEPYCGEVRRALLGAAGIIGMKAHDGGCYACTEGPRFETPAEIKMMRRSGADVVGMTSVPEVVLAREAGICYGAIATVTNMAAGLSGRVLSHQEVLAIMDSNINRLKQLFIKVIDLLPDERGCRCGESPPLPALAEGD